MTDFIVESLDLLPQPAAVWEWDSWEFIAANDVGRDSEVADVDRGLMDAAIDSMVKRGYYAKEDLHGVLLMTKIKTSRELARPELVLATYHPETFRENAIMQHQRMIMMLSVNERCSRTLTQLRHAHLAVETSMAAIRDILETTNGQAREFFALQQNFPAPRS